MKEDTEPCFLCGGLGKIAIGENKKIKLPESATCPFCEGKGFLDLKQEKWEE